MLLFRCCRRHRLAPSLPSFLWPAGQSHYSLLFFLSVPSRQQACSYPLGLLPCQHLQVPSDATEAASFLLLYSDVPVSYQPFTLVLSFLAFPPVAAKGVWLSAFSLFPTVDILPALLTLYIWLRLLKILHYNICDPYAHLRGWTNLSPFQPVSVCCFPYDLLLSLLFSLRREFPLQQQQS